MAITRSGFTVVDSAPVRRKPACGAWLLLAACLWLASGQSAAATGSATLSGFERPDANLADYHGHVVLLHFWASWCAPCLREIPALEAFYDGPYRQLSARGLVVLTVSNDFRIADVRRFQAERKFSAPIFLDMLGSLHDQMKMIGLPATAVIGRDGRIIKRLYGPQDWDSPAFRAMIEAWVAN